MTAMFSCEKRLTRSKNNNSKQINSAQSKNLIKMVQRV